MELIRSIARNVQAAPVMAAGADAHEHIVAFELDGRSIRLDIGPDQPPCPIRDGDDVIVAGEEQGNAIIGYAYKDLTQGYLGRRSTRRDLAQAGLIIVLASMFLWYAASADSELPVFLWTQRIVFLALGGLLAFLAAANLISIFQKFQAAFLVVRASIDTARGVARQVTADDGVVRLELDGRRVQLAAPNDAVREGDEMVVAGEIAGDVLCVVAYRNLTRAIFGSTWSLWELVFPILLVGLAAAILGLWWLDGSAEGLDITTVTRWILTVIIALGTMVLAVDRLFRWRLYLDAYRRVKHA